MTATNHVLAGAVIAAYVSEPWLALPLALMSHLLLDVLPHYGNPNHTSKKFVYTLAIDAGLAAAVLLSVLMINPENPWLIVAAGVLGASPDLLWFPHWLREIRGLPGKSKTRLESFLGDIQWCERSWGMIVEVPFGLTMLYFLLAAIY